MQRDVENLRQHKRLPGRQPPLLPDLPSPLGAPATLELDMQGGEGLHADEVVHHTRCIGIVGTVVELVDCTCWVLKALISEATDNRSQQSPSPTHPQPAEPCPVHMLTSPSRAGHAWGSPHRWVWTGPGRQLDC